MHRSRVICARVRTKLLLQPKSRCKTNANNLQLLITFLFFCQHVSSFYNRVKVISDMNSWENRLRELIYRTSSALNTHLSMHVRILHNIYNRRFTKYNVYMYRLPPRRSSFTLSSLLMYSRNIITVYSPTGECHNCWSLFGYGTSRAGRVSPVFNEPLNGTSPVSWESLLRLPNLRSTWTPVKINHRSCFYFWILSSDKLNSA